MIAVSADPGLTGAIALVCARRGPLEVASLPTCHNGSGKTALIQRKVDAVALLTLLRQWWSTHGLAQEHVIGVCERMQVFTGQDRASSPTTLVSLAGSAGIVEGVLAPRVQTFLTPTPRQWKLAIGVEAKKGKAASKETLARIYPHFGGAKTHDKADAILLGAWALGVVNGAVEESVPAYDPLAA